MGSKYQTSCIRGHLFDDANTYVRPGAVGRACRECKRMHTRKWYEKNRTAVNEGRKEYRRAYYLANKERAAVLGKAWHRENRERKDAVGKLWSASNPEKRKEIARRWQLKHPEQVKEYNNSWARRNRHKTREYERARLRSNPERYRERNRRRRARKRSAIGIWDNDAFIERQLFLYQEGKCFYCGIKKLNLLVRKTFHLEHCIPLFRGGLHCATNVVLACPTCNLRKGTKTVEEFREKNS